MDSWFCNGLRLNIQAFAWRGILLLFLFCPLFFLFRFCFAVLSVVTEIYLEQSNKIECHSCLKCWSTPFVLPLYYGYIMTRSFRFRNANFCLEKDSVTPFEWNTCMVKNALKSREIATNASVSFTRILFVHWILFLSSTAQDGAGEKGLKLEIINQPRSRLVGAWNSTIFLSRRFHRPGYF